MGRRNRKSITLSHLVESSDSQDFQNRTARQIKGISNIGAATFCPVRKECAVKKKDACPSEKLQLFTMATMIGKVDKGKTRPVVVVKDLESVGKPNEPADVRGRIVCETEGIDIPVKRVQTEEGVHWAPVEAEKYKVVFDREGNVYFKTKKGSFLLKIFKKKTE